MAARERRDDDGRKKDRKREDTPQREPGQDPQHEREDGSYDDDGPGSTQRERDEMR